jgi:hypothetical protein
MPDTKETREAKGRVKEQQRFEAELEKALEAADRQPEQPLEPPDDTIDLSFVE